MTKKPRRASWAYRINAPLPFLEWGGLTNSFLNSNQYKAIDTSNVNLPQGTSGVTQQKTNGMGIASAVGSAAGGIFSSLAANNRDAIAPDSSTQQTVDSLLNNIPFYSVGNSLGDWAATDYKNIQSDPNSADFGKLTDPGKYDVASTIGGFLGPDNLISGLSGDGWTAGQRRRKIEEQTAPQRQQIMQQQQSQLKQREVNAGLGGRYFDQNQMMMQAEFGGTLPEKGYYVDTVLGQSYEMGGPISKRYGMSRADLPQLSNYNSGIDIYEQGGQLEQQGMQMNPRPQITEYNEGGQHSENQSGYGGVPVDSHGNKVVVSGKRPTASVESGEVSWWNPKTKSAFVFSNKIHI